MATPFLWLRCFCGFAVSRFAVSKKAECHAELVSASDSAFLFLFLACAELKVNFVEGFAVLWLRRLSGIICLLSR